MSEKLVAESNRVEPERHEVWSQLANAVNVRGARDQVLWSIFGAFWAANAILLVALFTTGDLPTNALVGVLVCGFGVILALTWIGTQDRALLHLRRDELVIERLERRLGLDEESALSLSLNEADWNEGFKGGLSVRALMRGWALFTAVAWALGLILFFVRSLS